MSVQAFTSRFPDMNLTMFTHFLVTLLFTVSLVRPIFGSSTGEIYKGVLTLDELTFDKTVSRFRYALVKFDNAYPYGLEHETYVRLGQQLAKLKRTDAIAVNLEVKDYGEMDSHVLAKRYGIEKEAFPAVRLFINPPNTTVSQFIKLKPIVYEEERDEATNKIVLNGVSMSLFFRQQTGIQLTLPNCTEDLDRLASEFIDNLPFDRLSRALDILEEVERMSEKSSREKRKSAKVYLKFMQKGIERGALFFESEHKRIVNLLTDIKEKITPSKRKDLKVHYNVLQSFLPGKYPKEEPDAQLGVSGKKTSKIAAKKTTNESSTSQQKKCEL